MEANVIDGQCRTAIRHLLQGLALLHGVEFCATELELALGAIEKLVQGSIRRGRESVEPVVEVRVERQFVPGNLDDLTRAMNEALRDRNVAFGRDI